MKKLLKLLSVSLILALMLALCATPALASTYDHCADALYEMGLFAGTDKGYELDATPDRSQAAVMLVRLLGKEAEALAGQYAHPFTDVPDWADAYIGYMYENGLTKGVSADKYDAAVLCDAKMFYTFVLRAMGYNDAAGDFSYAAANTFAAKQGLITFDSISFNRDNMVAIAYNALATRTKGAETTLLDKLVTEGAVDAEIAKPYQKMFTAYKNYWLAQNDFSDYTNISYTMNYKTDYDSSRRYGFGEGSKDVVVMHDGENSKLSVRFENTAVDAFYQLYIIDRVLYINANGEKASSPIIINSIVGQSVFEDALADITFFNICELASISQQGTVYTTTLHSTFHYSYADGVHTLSDAYDENDVTTLNVTYSKYTTVFTFDHNNKLFSIKTNFNGTAGLEKTKYDISTSIEVINIEVDNAVKFEPPSDLDSY